MTKFGYRLPSNLSGAYFQVWFGMVPTPDVTARERARRIAEEATENASVLEAKAMELRLRLSLAEADLGCTDLHVRVEAEPASLELAKEYENVVRESLLNTERMTAGAKRLRLFKEQVLDQGLTGLWWLAEQPDRLLGAGQNDEVILRALNILASAPSASQEDVLADGLKELVADLGPQGRHYLVRALPQFLKGIERDDLAARVDGRLSEATGSEGPPRAVGAIGVGRPYSAGR